LESELDEIAITELYDARQTGLVVGAEPIEPTELVEPAEPAEQQSMAQTVMQEETDRREERKQERRDRRNQRRQEETQALVEDEPTLGSLDRVLTEAKLNCRINKSAWRVSGHSTTTSSRVASASRRTVVWSELPSKVATSERKHTRTHTGMCINSDQGSVADFRFAHVFLNRPFGLTFTRNERKHASFASSFATTQVSLSTKEELVQRGDLLLKIGEEDVTSFSMKEVFEQMKTATLPLSLTFCRVPEETDSMTDWAQPVSANSHTSTSTTLPPAAELSEDIDSNTKHARAQTMPVLAAMVSSSGTHSLFRPLTTILLSAFFFLSSRSCYLSSSPSR
jgi:hypothetical protein